MKNNNLSKEFWILTCIVSVAAMIGILSNPTNQPPWGKFVVGIVLGIGISCLVFAIFILAKNKK
jgi:predicted membrane channel-forming protein YqfA (hemolysin III family)